MPAETRKPVYGNWVSDGRIRKVALWFALFVLADAALMALVRGWLALKLIVILIAALFLAALIFFWWAKRLLSPEGGDIQGKILDLLLSRVGWDGNGSALDVGCGSGRLAIQLAQKYPDAAVTGIDFWGSEWGYSKEQCEENARIEGVGERTAFRQASASKLPFADGSFDLVVSNLTFHEVRDTNSKLDAVKEALRVLKPGGRFVLQDLFQLKQYYGTPDELKAAVARMGAKEVRFVDTGDAPFVRGVLKLPFMLGTLGLIYGVKE